MMGVHINWRDDPATHKQIKLIEEMQEFSEFPLPAFTGTTKGEAYDYISAHLAISHERFDYESHGDNFGDRI